METPDLYWYRARPSLRGVIDGDTVDLDIDLGMRVGSTQRIRLLNVMAPERGQPGGAEATSEVTAWLSVRTGYTAWPLLVHTVKDRQSFNRYVADVFDAASGDHLNHHMRQFLATGGTP